MFPRSSDRAIASCFPHPDGEQLDEEASQPCCSPNDHLHIAAQPLIPGAVKNKDRQFMPRLLHKRVLFFVDRN